jgi:hypothetical protein
MPRLPFNLSLLHCPDFSAQIYNEHRARFVNANVTDDQAAVLLTEFWRADNELQIQQWEDQILQDMADDDAERHQHQLAAAADDLLIAQEQENLLREERKRNRSKYIAIPDRPMPAVTPIYPSEYAVKKMEKVAYVELWYYTNDGLDDAARSHSATEDEAMVIGRNPDGSASWIPAAAARESKKILDNRDISWDSFTQAAPRMLVAMTNAGWPMGRVAMLGAFWGNLQTHELRRSQNPLDQKTLLMYQAKHHLQWHMAITSTDGAYNLSILDERRMRTIREEVYWSDRAQKDNARDCELTPMPYALQQHTHFPFHMPPHILVQCVICHLDAPCALPSPSPPPCFHVVPRTPNAPRACQFAPRASLPRSRHALPAIPASAPHAPPFFHALVTPRPAHRSSL